MNRNVLTLIGMLHLLLVGCGGTGGGDAATDLDEFDYYVNEGPFKGWIDAYYEPFGDESWCYYKITPEQYAAGESVTLEIAAGTGYGPTTDVTLSYRCSNGSSTDEFGNINNHTQGIAWNKITPAGQFYHEYSEENDAYTRSWLPYSNSVAEEQSYEAFTHHKATFVIPEGQAVIEMRIEQPGGRFGSITIPPTDYAVQLYPLPTEE